MKQIKIKSIAAILTTIICGCTTDKNNEPDYIHFSVEKRGYYLTRIKDSVTNQTHSEYLKQNAFAIVLAHNTDAKVIDSIAEIDMDGMLPSSFSTYQVNGFCWPNDNEWLYKGDRKPWCTITHALFSKDSSWDPKSIHFKYSNYEETIPLEFPEEIKIVAPNSTDTFTINENVKVKIMGHAQKIFFEFLKVYSFEYDTSMTDTNEYVLRKEKYSEYGVPWGVKVKPYTEFKKNINSGTILDVELFNLKNGGIPLESDNTDLQRTWNRKKPFDRLN